MFDELGQFVDHSSSERESIRRSSPNTGASSMSSRRDTKNLNLEVPPPISCRLISDVKKSPHIFRSLLLIQNAKSFIYTTPFFGDKMFYADDFDFTKAPLHRENRRNIRFRLKSILDLVVKIDLHRLRTYLLQSDRVEKITACRDVEHITPLVDDSFATLLKLANHTKCKQIMEILERIISNLHFSQSMNKFFASDNSIEAAKLMMSQADKKGPDFGKFLRGRSFASCVQAYRNLSRFDYRRMN